MFWQLQDPQTNFSLEKHNVFELKPSKNKKKKCLGVFQAPGQGLQLAVKDAIGIEVGLTSGSFDQELPEREEHAEDDAHRGTGFDAPDPSNQHDQ